MNPSRDSWAGTYGLCIVEKIKPKGQGLSFQTIKCKQRVRWAGTYMLSIVERFGRKETSQFLKQWDASKKDRWAGTYLILHKKQNGSQFLQCKSGPLSGHLLAVDRRKIQPKGKESVFKQWSASKKDSWAGTYKLSIVEKFGQNERSQLTNKNVRAKRTADSQFSNGTSLPPRLEQAQLLLH